MADLSEANRREWNERARSYDTAEWQQTLSNQLVAFIRQQTENIGIRPIEKGQLEEVKLLDYACGPGMMTRALRDYITSATGVDIADGMIDQYETRMRDDGIKASAVVGNLAEKEMSASLQGRDVYGFDIAAIALGFHHLHNSQLVVERLRERLNPNGILLILDWLPSGGEANHQGQAHSHDTGHVHGHGHGHEYGSDDFAAMRHTIAHNGFTEAMMKDLFESAGLTDFHFVLREGTITVRPGGKEVKKSPFLASARKP